MEDLFMRVWENFIGRLDGPMHLRILLQPTIASILAIRSGLKDARENRPPYFWAIFTDSASRKDLLRNGWKVVGKVFIMAMVIDTIYQLIVLRWFYPIEALIAAIMLAIVPYLLIRGPVNRLARLWQHPTIPSPRTKHAG